MDKFKSEQMHYVGPGGFHCACCNEFHGKDKKVLNKLARKRLKNQLNKELDDETDKNSI